MQDNVSDRMYINYGSSDNWTIIQECLDRDIIITSVKCLNDSTWNMQPQCPGILIMFIGLRFRCGILMHKYYILSTRLLNHINFSKYVLMKHKYCIY